LFVNRGDGAAQLVFQQQRFIAAVGFGGLAVFVMGGSGP
jgi:hypothetical protein